MCTDDTFDTYESPDDSSQGTYEAPDDGAAGGERPGWSRRTFLKAAALGTAAAALLHHSGGDGGGLSSLGFGPLSALANDLSDFPCTAQDIDVGEGVVINEPCAAANCTGTFCALVKFPVFNNTSTGRYCISLHLPAQGNIPQQDVLLKTGFATGGTGPCGTPGDPNTCPTLTGTSTAAGRNQGESTHLTIMYGVITNFPCSAGRVCFGNEVPADFTGKCTQAGIAPCATIGFSTTPGDATCAGADQRPPRGQCRHRQICVRGFGATLECADGSCNAITATTCDVPCGQPLKLKGSASGGTTDCDGNACTTPPTLTLTGPGITTPLSPDANGCFTVNNPQAGTYTLTATDCHGCTRTASKAVTVTEITATLTDTTPSATCSNGQRTFSASGGTSASCTYTFSVDGTVVQAASTTTTFTYDPVALACASGGTFVPFNTCHTVRVDIDCGGSCTAHDEIHFTQCVGTTGEADGACP
jgi:hypothetical protein